MSLRQRSSCVFQLDRLPSSSGAARIVPEFFQGQQHAPVERNDISSFVVDRPEEVKPS
jgi:hypothetical protein